MGRKSPLTPEQWLDVERRHLIDGESVRALAKEYGVDEAAIRRRINPNKSAKSAPGKSGKSLRELAEEKVRAESVFRDISAEISALPVARQQIVANLAQKLTSISTHMVCAAEYGAATAHRLMGIAHTQSALVDESDPNGEDSAKALRSIDSLTNMANTSSALGMSLLRANREAVADLTRKPPPPPVTADDLSKLSDDELAVLANTYARLKG